MAEAAHVAEAAHAVARRDARVPVAAAWKAAQGAVLVVV